VAAFECGAVVEMTSNGGQFDSLRTSSQASMGEQRGRVGYDHLYVRGGDVSMQEPIMWITKTNSVVRRVSRAELSSQLPNQCVGNGPCGEMIWKRYAGGLGRLGRSVSSVDTIRRGPF